MARPHLSDSVLWRYISGRVPSLAAAVLAGTSAGAAYAGPQVQNVAAGQVSVNQQGSTTVITASHNSIINYTSFQIAANETVRFVQPNAQSRVLNRVNSPDPTRIDGSLLSNGRVYLVSPAGIFFGSRAVVNVAELHAAAGAMSNQDFLSGTDRFTQLTGMVENRGVIRADTVSLLGHRVANLGSIVAPEGSITLAAGDSVYITHHGGVVSAKVDASGLRDDGSSAGVLNEGTLDAQGGQVRLGAGDIYALAIRQRGSVKGADVQVEADGGRVELDGSVEASGGVVEVLGHGGATLTGSGRIDTSGVEGGGSVAIAFEQGAVSTPEIVTGDAHVASGSEVVIANAMTASGAVTLVHTRPTGAGVSVEAALEAGSVVVNAGTGFDLTGFLTTTGGDVVIDATGSVGIFGVLETGGGDLSVTGRDLLGHPVGALDTRGVSGDGTMTLMFDSFVSTPPALYAGDLDGHFSGLLMQSPITASGTVDLSTDTALDIRGLVTAGGDALLTAGTVMRLPGRVVSTGGSIVVTAPTLTLTTTGTLELAGGGLLLGDADTAARAIVLDSDVYRISASARLDAGDHAVVLRDTDASSPTLVLGDGVGTVPGARVFGPDALRAVRAGSLEAGREDLTVLVGRVSGEGVGLLPGTSLRLQGQSITLADIGSSIDLGGGLLELTSSGAVAVHQAVNAGGVMIAAGQGVSIHDAITSSGAVSINAPSLLIGEGASVLASGQPVGLMGDIVSVYGEVDGQLIDLIAPSLVIGENGVIGSAGTAYIGFRGDAIAYLLAQADFESAVFDAEAPTPVLMGETVSLIPLAGTAVDVNALSSEGSLYLSGLLLERIEAQTLAIGDASSGRITLGSLPVGGTTSLVLTTGADIVSDPAAGPVLNFASDGSLTMAAQTGIGSEQSPLVVSVPELEAVSATGGVYLRNGRSLESVLVDAGDADVVLDVEGEILDTDIELDLLGKVVRVSAASSVQPLQTEVQTLVFNEVTQNGGEGQLTVTGDLTGFSFDSLTKAAVLTAGGSISDVVLNVPKATLIAGADIVNALITASGRIELLAGGNIENVTATAGSSLIAEATGYIRSSILTAGTTMQLKGASIGTEVSPVLVSAPVINGSTTSGSAYMEGPGSGVVSLAFIAADMLRFTGGIDLMQGGTWEGSTVDIDTQGSMRLSSLVRATDSETIYLASGGVMMMDATANLDTASSGADIVLTAADLEIAQGARIDAGSGTVVLMPWEGQSTWVGDLPDSNQDPYAGYGDFETAVGWHVDQAELNAIAGAGEIALGSTDSGPMWIGTADLGGRGSDLKLYSGSTIDEMADDMAVKLRTDGRLTMIAGGEIGRDPVGDEASPYDALDIEVDSLYVDVFAPGKVSLRDEGGLTVEMIYTTSGDIYLESTGEIIALDVTANSDIDFTSQQGGIQVGRMQASEGVNLNAVQGAIVRAPVANQQIVAPSTTMSARSVGAAGAPIQTSVNSMTVTTSGGGQNLAQTGNLGSLNLNAGTGSVNLVVQGAVNDADPGVDIRAGSMSVTAGRFGGPAQRIQLAAGEVSVTSDSTINVGDPEGVLRSANLSSNGSIEIRTTSANARISASGGALNVDQPQNLSEDLPQAEAADEPETGGIDLAEPLWVVGEFAERDGWLDEHELLRELSEQWGERLAFYIEQGLRARGERVGGVSEELSEQEMRSLIAQGLEYFCQGVLEDLALGQDAQGQPVATLTLVYELQKNVSNHMTLVQKKRLRTRDGSEPQVTPQDLDDLLQLAAERIVDRLIDDAPTGMMGVRG